MRAHVGAGRASSGLPRTFRQESSIGVSAYLKCWDIIVRAICIIRSPGRRLSCRPRSDEFITPPLSIRRATPASEPCPGATGMSVQAFGALGRAAISPARNFAMRSIKPAGTGRVRGKRTVALLTA